LFFDSLEIELSFEQAIAYIPSLDVAILFDAQYFYDFRKLFEISILDSFSVKK
jgi:hypothetical protein